MRVWEAGALGPRLLLLALAALCCTACPSRFPAPADEITDPEVILASLRAREGQVDALTAALSSEIWKGDERVRLRQLIAVKSPDQLRIDTLSPFDQPLSTLVSDGRVLSVYSLEERSFLQGAATAANLSRLLPLRLEPSELVSMLRGGAPLIRHDEALVSWDDTVGAYLLTLVGGPQRQTLHIEPAGLRPIRARLQRSGRTVYDARFGDYVDTPDLRTGPAVPRRMRFEVPSETLSVELQVREVELGADIPDDAFRLEPPRGIPVEPL